MGKFIFIIFIFFCTYFGFAQNQKNSCEFIKGLSDISEIECGQLVVPEDHENPGGKKISVAYVIIKSKLEQKKEPVILLGGGPGGEMISVEIISFLLNDPLREKRDIILYEQRGIGYSSGLPDINPDLERIMAANLSEDEEKVELKKLLTLARERAEKLNINPANYNTWQNAHDIGLLMRDLNYPKYNLFGLSFGTRLGRKIQDLYPEYLNVVIHNSPALSTGDFLIDRLQNYSDALEKVLNYCSDDPTCKLQYPRLRESYIETIEKLKSSPIQFEVDGIPFYVNAQDAIYFLRRVLYWNNSLEIAPAFIEEMSKGGGPILQDLIMGVIGDNYNNLMWLSVERNEMYDPNITGQEIEAMYRNLPLLPAELGLFTGAYLAMNHLHDNTLSEEKRTPLVSSVPTMIMVNQYDPVTPPENGYIFKEKLPNAFLYILDEGGHGGGNVDCRNRVMIAFMDDPGKSPDSSCLKLVQE